MKRWIGLVLVAGLLWIPLGAAVSEPMSQNVLIRADSYTVLIGADGEEKTEAGEYSLIQSISPEDVAPEDELFCAFPAGEVNAAVNLGLLLNARGEALSEAQYQYIQQEEDRLIYKRDGRYGVMDLELREIVPCVYTQIASNGEGGYLALTTDFEDDKPDGVYYVDAEGNETPTGIRVNYGLTAFSEGLMPAVSSDNYKYGYLDAGGEWAIQPQYWYAGEFYQGRAAASLESGAGLIDASGNWLLSPKYRMISLSLPGGDMIMATPRRSVIELIDHEDFHVIKRFEGEEIYANTVFDMNLAVLYDNSATRLINQEGEELFSFEGRISYEVWSDMGDRVVVQRGAVGDMSAYLYTLDGKELFGPAQEISFLGECDGRKVYAYSLYDVEVEEEPAVEWQGLWEVEGTRTIGLIDEGGQRILEPIPCSMISYGADDVLIVRREDRMELINCAGEVRYTVALRGE